MQKQKIRLVLTCVKSPLNDNQDKIQDIKRNKQIVSAESGTEFRHCIQRNP